MPDRSHSTQNAIPCGTHKRGPTMDDCDYIWHNGCRFAPEQLLTVSAGGGEVWLASGKHGVTLRAPQLEVASVMRVDGAVVVLPDAGPLECITAARELLERTLDHIQRDGWVNGVQEEAVRLIQTMGELTAGESGPTLTGRRS